MMIRSEYLLFILFGHAAGQQLTSYNAAVADPVVACPARCTEYEETRATFHYRRAWLAIPGSPENLAFTFVGRARERKFSFGLKVDQDRAGFFAHTTLNGI